APNAIAPVATHPPRYPDTQAAPAKGNGSLSPRNAVTTGMTPGSIIAVIITIHVPAKPTGLMSHGMARPTFTHPSIMPDLSRASPIVHHHAPPATAVRNAAVRSRLLRFVIAFVIAGVEPA